MTDHAASILARAAFQLRHFGGGLNEWRSAIPRPISLLVYGALVAVSITACTPNAPYRTDGAVPCSVGACDPATYLEQHDDQNYDLAFVEFSERGNVFSRERMNEILRFVGDKAKFDSTQPNKGVLAIVFVHGWKHNASAQDENVRSFRKLLEDTGAISSRKVVGVMSDGAACRSTGVTRSPAFPIGNERRPQNRSPRGA